MTTIHKTNIYTPRHTPRTRTRTRTRQHISKYKKFSFNNLLFNINNKTNNQSKNQSKKQTKNSKKTLFNNNNNNNKIELLLLFSTLLNYFILLNTNNVSCDIYKDKIVNLLKALRTNNRLISNDTTDDELNIMYNSMHNYFNNMLITLTDEINIHHKSIVKTQKPYKYKHKGGFYFTSLEDKGDKPITGTDITKFLDEIQKFFGNAKYTSEGAFLQDMDMVISMFRDDLRPFQSMLQYRVYPKYYKKIPPFIQWSGFKEAIDSKKWEDFPDYLLAYQTYLRSKDEYLVSKGLKSPDELTKPNFIEELGQSADGYIQKFQQTRNKLKGNVYPIGGPV